MATLHLDVVTPERTVVQEDVEMVICPGSEGEFGVLPRHASLLSALKTGILRYKCGDTTQLVFIAGGFVDVHDDQCSVLAEVAEHAKDIDEGRALAAKERAERRLLERNEELDALRAEIALQKALLRLQILELSRG